MEKFSLPKLAIILIFMMKAIGGSAVNDDDDDGDLKACERSVVCRVGSNMLTQALHIEEGLSENFISALLHSVLGTNGALAETFIRLINDFETAMPYVVHYIRAAAAAASSSSVSVLEQLGQAGNVSGQMKSEMQRIYEQFKESYERVLNEEVNKLGVFEREVLKCINDIQGFIAGFSRASEHENGGLYSSLEALISECNEIHSELLKSDFHSAQVQIEHLTAELEQLYGSSQIEREVRDEISVLTTRVYEISEALARRDIQAVNSGMQQFMMEIQAFYSDIMRSDIESGRRDLSEIDRMMNEIEKFLQRFVRGSFEELSIEMQKVSEKIEKFKNSSMTTQWVEEKKIIKSVQSVFDRFAREEIRDFKIFETELEKCMIEVFRFLETIGHQANSELTESELLRELQTFYEHLMESKTKSTQTKVIDLRKLFEKLLLSHNQMNNTDNEISSEIAKSDSAKVQVQNSAREARENYGKAIEAKTRAVEEEYRKMASETKRFYEFMIRDSAFVANARVDIVAQTHYQIENFMRQIQQCLQVLKANGDKSERSELMEFEMTVMYGDVKRFYDRVIECEVHRVSLPHSEFIVFTNKIRGVNEHFLNDDDDDDDDEMEDYEHSTMSDEIEESQTSKDDQSVTLATEVASSTSPLVSDQVSSLNSAAAASTLMTDESTTEQISSLSNATDPASQLSSSSNLISDCESFIKNFNENSCTRADMENLQLKISKLITVRGAAISGRNMQMEIDKLVERARHLLERTRENCLKNYTRLQQLMNIVKEKMSEELVYRGDMEALDKHIVEINALLPRMEVNYQIAANSTLRSYARFRELMAQRNDAMIRLQAIAVELKEANFTGENGRVKADIVAIGKVFRNTSYSKVAEVLLSKVNLIVKANEILDIADDILRASEKDFQLNLEQIYTVKQKVLVILQATKNIATKQRAAGLYQRLIARLGAYESEVMEKLENVSEKLSHLESLNLRQLRELSDNLKSIGKSFDNERIMMKVDELLMQIGAIEQRFDKIRDELEFMESTLNGPSFNNNLSQLKSYLSILADLGRFSEPTILSKVKELDASIKKAIYDYQVKNELGEINRELINIEQAQTGSDISDNIMRLQNLEIKIEEIEADNETEDDVQEVLDNIQQMRRALPLKTTQLARATSARVLRMTVDEIVAIVGRIGAQIVDLDSRLTQLDQSNESQFGVALKRRKDTLSNETNRIALAMEDVREALASMPLPPSDRNETEIIAQNNGSIAVIIDQLLALNQSLANDSQVSALYEATVRNANDLERVHSALEKTLEMMEGSTSEITTTAAATLDDDVESGDDEAAPDETAPQIEAEQSEAFQMNPN